MLSNFVFWLMSLESSIEAEKRVWNNRKVIKKQARNIILGGNFCAILEKSESGKKGVGQEKLPNNRMYQKSR